METTRKGWIVWKAALVGVVIGIAWRLIETGFQLGETPEATVDAMGQLVGFGLGAGVLAAIIAVARNYATRRP